MSPALASVEIEGFKSIESLKLELINPVTLLIGANGAGKSNVVEAFEMLGYTVDRGLQAYAVRHGGFSQLVHRSLRSGLSERITLKAWGDWNDSQSGNIRNGYRMTLAAGPDDSATLDEKTYVHKETYSKPYQHDLAYGKESHLKESASAHYANQYLLGILSGCRVFHFDDTSSSAPPLRRSNLSDSESLHADGGNLASVLYDIRSNHLPVYNQIVRSIRNVAPFFEDFVLRPENDSLLLRWRERGLDNVFSGSALSSGTLRFICLTVLLQQPRQPETIVLDEPELGLHPAAIHQLADLFRSINSSQRLVAATQSVTLLGQFSVDEIAVVERTNGSTSVSRPNKEELAEWLDDYSVGELWEMNLLGGRPGTQPASNPVGTR
jgi:predicted ATPase